MAQLAPPLPFTMRVDGPDVVVAYEKGLPLAGAELRVPVAACGGPQMMPRLHQFLVQRTQAERITVPSRAAIWFREVCTWPVELLTGGSASPSAGGCILALLVGGVGLGVGIANARDGRLGPAVVMTLVGLLGLLGSWGFGSHFVRKDRQERVAGHQWEVMRSALRQASRTEPVQRTLAGALTKTLGSLFGKG